MEQFIKYVVKTNYHINFKTKQRQPKSHSIQAQNIYEIYI